ncbi:MAG: NTP transferase domain-containing protein [Candidatus Omnitrophica bacterium]|nr:NTP transferase domain-containing protein [Candidatus Omnitrophota bacterium]
MRAVQVVVLAGGKGTRLLPYTAVMPKPLVPVGEMPILEILLRQLRRDGLTKILMAVGHMEHLLRAYFGDGRKWRLRIEYLREGRPLGTVGVLGALDWTAGPILVVNGDILTNLNFQELVKTHLRARNLLTLAVCQREIPIDFGVVDLDAQGCIRRYREKPRDHYFVSTGIVVVSPGVRRLIGRGEALNLPDLVNRALSRHERVEAVVSRAFWLDIGRPDDYALAQRLVERHPGRFIPRGPR